MDPTVQGSDGFAMAVLVEGGLTVVAIVFAWLFHISLREQFAPWGRPLVVALLRGIAATVPMLLIFWWLINSSWPLLRQLREQVEWLVAEMFPSASTAQFAMVALLAGVGEELLFRGVLQTKLGEWTTPVIGLLITSFLFGLAHALSKLYFTFAIVVGAFLGWMAIEYHDLVAPMLAHGLYDFIALMYLSKNSVTRLRQKTSAASSSTPSDDLPPGA